MSYAELHCLSNYSFLRGASHPQELVEQAAHLGYSALAITDECSLAGVVKAHVTAKELSFKLIIGSEFTVSEGLKLVAIAPSRVAYGELSSLISRSRRRSEKGHYLTHLRDIYFHLKRCFIIWLPDDIDAERHHAEALARRCPDRFWIGIHQLLRHDDLLRLEEIQALADEIHVPTLACGSVEMHSASRKMLHDVVTAIRHNTAIHDLGQLRLPNSQQHLRRLDKIIPLYPQTLIGETLRLAQRCNFSLDELRYEYPEEVVPKGHTANSYLRDCVTQGASKRWPQGVPSAIHERIERELALITELNYEYYFLDRKSVV